MSSLAGSSNEKLDAEAEPHSSASQDGLKLLHLLQSTTAEVILPVLTEYLLTEHTCRKNLLQQPALHAAIIQDLRQQDPSANTITVSTSFALQSKPTQEVISHPNLSDLPVEANSEPSTLHPSINNDHRNKVEAGSNGVFCPVSSTVDGRSSVPLDGLLPNENQVDGPAVDGQGKAVVAYHSSANPAPQGGNLKRKRPTAAWKPKVRSEEFVYSSTDTDDPKLPSLWERENTRWSKAGLGDVWSDAVAGLDRDDKTSVHHMRRLFSKARFIIQQSCGKQLQDFIAETERLRRHWGADHRTPETTVCTVKGIEQFRRGWIIANKENEAGKVVQSALKSNALADIYEGYYNIPTTDTSTQSNASTGLVEGGPNTSLVDTNTTVQSTVPQGSGLFVPPFPMPEASTSRPGRRATRRVAHTDYTLDGIRAKKVMALGLGIIPTKLTQTLNKSRNYATLRRGVGGPAIFAVLCNTPRSLIETYSKRETEILVAVINRVTQLEQFTSHRDLLQVMNTMFMDCMIPEKYEGDHFQSLIDRLRSLCEENFEQDGSESSESDAMRGDSRVSSTIKQPDFAPQTKRRSRSHSSPADVLGIPPDGSTLSRPLLVDEGHVDTPDVTLGEDERVGGAFMSRYMRLLCDVYNNRDPTSVCITVDPSAWDQCKTEPATGTITLPKNSVWPGIFNTTHCDASSITHWLIPIHDPSKEHWVLLHGFRNDELAQQLYIQYYDSLGRGLNAHARKLVAVQLTWLCQVLGLNPSKEALTLHQPHDQPIQSNGFDCGVIVMLVAKAKIMGQTIQQDADTVKHMRISCVREINTSCLT